LPRSRFRHGGYRGKLLGLISFIGRPAVRNLCRRLAVEDLGIADNYVDLTTASQAAVLIRRIDSSRSPLMRSASRCGSRVNFMAKSSAVSPAETYSL
jgi:hypothetical protein